MAQAQLSVLLNGKDNLTPTIKNVQKSLTDLGSKGSKLDDIQKGFNKIQNSSAPLSKKIRDIKKEMEALVVSGHNTTAEGKKMWEEMSKAAKHYDEQLKQIQRDTKASGNVKGGFDLKGMASGIGDKIGLGGVGSQMGAALANPYVLAGAAIAGAGKALYDYNVELDRSLQKTAQFTGLSGDALMSLRNGIKSVSDTFGKDYDTVLASVDGLMSQFGIDGEEALQIIRNGFIAGADDSGKMLDMISRYSGAFNDAGISASEMVSIISNTRSGIFSEEGMELFSKGATKIREFSSNLQSALEGVGINADEMYRKLQSGEISTVQAIQSISTQLKGLNPQSQEVGEVLKQVFGKTGAKAGYELVTALADVQTNLEEAKKQTGEWGVAMEQLEKADREFENALSSLFGIADGGFSTMTNKLKAEVYGAVAKVINGFIEWYNKSIIVRSAIANIALQFKNAWEIIKGILKIFMSSIQSLSEMIEGVLTLDWNKVKAGWKNGMSNILSTIATGFENIKENVADAADQIQNGQIKKIEVPVEVEYTENNKGGGSRGTGKGKGSGGSSSKGGKKEEIIDVNSIKYAQNQLQKLQDEKLKIPVDATEKLAENKKQIEYWEKEIERRKILVELNTSYADDKLQQLQSKLKSLYDEKGKVNVDDSMIKQIDSEIEEIQNEINKKLELKVTANDTEINKIDDEILNLQSLVQEKNSLGVSADDSEIIDLENKVNELLEKKNYLLSISVNDEALINSDSELKSLQNQLTQLKNQKVDLELSFNETSIDDEINNVISEINSRKVEIFIETKYDDSNLNGLRERLKQLENLRYTLSPDDTETFALLNAEIKKTKDRIDETEMKMGIKPYIDPNSLQGVNKRISEIKDELNRMDINLNPQRYEELMNDLKNAEDEAEKLNEKLSGLSTPSIKDNDNKKFEKGSVEDKRQSLANANSIAEQYVSDYKMGIIGFDDVKNKFTELNSMLSELDPKLKLDLHINDDGTITTAAEDLEIAKSKIDSIGGAIGQMGSVFGSLGSAIGGTSGEILGFAGTTISAIGQIIPQIVGLIAAQNAEAIAAGTASGAALPFPANIAAIASIIATIAGIFASLPQFATGGVVGGSSYSGDKVLARLNSGEGVLTRKGMSNLQNVMNGSDNSKSLGGNVTFKIEGTTLKGVLNNVNRKIAKQS